MIGHLASAFSSPCQSLRGRKEFASMMMSQVHRNLVAGYQSNETIFQNLQVQRAKAPLAGIWARSTRGAWKSFSRITRQSQLLEFG